VIVNVTGGSDMSLIEVNEALTIIQESAHEDAEIIFGAVVDETLNGRVKITVIATGFDHVKADRVAPSTPLQTPVDMQAYTSQLRPASEPAAAAPPRFATGRRATDAMLNGTAPMASSHTEATASTWACRRRAATSIRTWSSMCRRFCVEMRARRVAGPLWGPVIQ
jgi:cell division protein FtsZ